MHGASSIAPGAAASPGAMASPGPAGAARRWYSAFVAAFALFTIFAGAEVKSRQAGLAVPDWPLSYGQLMPPMNGNIFYEHGHRMIATTVGLLTIVLAVWTARREQRAWVRRLAWVCLVVVCAQGLLGGLTVLHLLPPALSISHGVLAQTYLMLVTCVAFAVSREGSAPAAARALPESAIADRAVRAAGIAVIAVWVQLVLGAVMRHNEAGLAVRFFPVDEAGRLLPETVDARVVLHMLHRGFAFVVLPLLLLAAWRAARAWPRSKAHAVGLGLLGLSQVLLGATIIWTYRHHPADGTTPVVSPIPASLHVVTGALILALTWLLFLRLRHARGAAR